MAIFFGRTEPILKRVALSNSELNLVVQREKKSLLNRELWSDSLKKNKNIAKSKKLFTASVVPPFLLVFYQEDIKEEEKDPHFSLEDSIAEFFSSGGTKKSLRFNQLGVILSVLLVVILSLFTLSLYKNNNMKSRVNALMHQKNEELTRAKEKAEAASQAKEQFLSNISHELRTPIYAVTGLTYLLLNEYPTESQKEHLDSLKYSGDHLLALINNILDLNKLEAKKVKLVRTDFDLEKVLNNFFGTLKQSAETKNVSLHLEIGQDIPSQLNGDMLKVSQILMNLVSNAIKFTDNGDVWIRVNKQKELDEEVQLLFEVEDNGIGIPKKEQKSIFENFEQGHAEINTDYGGTGLGLSIVKNLLQFLGSEIKLESEEGRGSRFYFQLDFRKTKIQVEDNFKKQRMALSKEEQNRVFKGKKVLIVDDNKLNQKITQRILEKRQMLCELSGDGKEAIAQLSNNRFDVILMDIHMPEMDGIEATKIIRQSDKRTPIIALTAVSIDQEMDEFLKNGFTDFIPKPYETEVFFEKMYQAVQST